MTREEAITVTEYVLHAWARPEWSPGQIETFAGALLPYEADIATQALALAHKNIGYRPSFSDFLGFYRAARADAQSRQHTPPPAPTVSNVKLPLWVKRWIAARLYYQRFGRDQDMRRFPEEGDLGDPSVPLMPPDEWVAEANTIGDEDAMRAVRQLPLRSP